MDYYYKIVIESHIDGGFTAYVPKLPGCVSEGDTYNETLENIKEALELYIETLQERNQTIVQDDTHITELCVSL